VLAVHAQRDLWLPTIPAEMTFAKEESQEEAERKVVKLRHGAALQICCFTVKFHVQRRPPVLFHRHVSRGTGTDFLASDQSLC
jgi:hypothetical protein